MADDAEARPDSSLSLRSPSRIHITELERSDHANPTPLTSDSGRPGTSGGRRPTFSSEAAIRPAAELSDSKMFPSGDSATDLYPDYLSPTRLRQLSGLQELGMVTFLEMRVDTREHSLGNFGSWLPGLRQLKLNHSIVATIRDLGTALSRLEILWVANCALQDLDGISALSGLKELYLAFNEVSEVSSISLLDDLQVVDLEGNRIDDIAQVGFLALCLQLDTLTLCGNPCCSRPDPSHPDPAPGYDYRATVKQTIPGLRVLDDEMIDNRSRPRPLGSSLRHSVSHSHLGHTRPSSSHGLQAGNIQEATMRTSLRRSSATASAQPLGNDLFSRSSTNLDLDDSSDMTYGTHQVFCGNLSKALRKRRKSTTRLQIEASEDRTDTAVTASSGPKSVEPVFRESQKENVVAELRAWKDEFEHGSSMIKHASELKGSPIKSSEQRADSSEVSPAELTQERRVLESAKQTTPLSTTDDVQPTPPKEPQPKYRRRLPARPMTAHPNMQMHTHTQPHLTRRRLPVPPPPTPGQEPYIRASKDMVLPHRRIPPLARPTTAQPKLQRSASATGAHIH